MEITSAQVQEIFGIESPGTITKWKKIGADSAYLGRNRWDAGKFIQWWAETIYIPNNDKEILSHRERWEKARADKAEIEVSEKLRDLLPRDEIKSALSELIAMAKRGFMVLPKSAPVMLYGQTETEMMGTLEKMVLQILEDMSRGASIDEIERNIHA